MKLTGNKFYYYCSTLVFFCKDLVCHDVLQGMLALLWCILAVWEVFVWSGECSGWEAVSKAKKVPVVVRSQKIFVWWMLHWEWRLVWG